MILGILFVVLSLAFYAYADRVLAARYAAERARKSLQRAQARANRMVDSLEDRVGEEVVAKLGGKTELSEFFLLHELTMTQQTYDVLAFTLTRDSPAEHIAAAVELIRKLQNKYGGEWSEERPENWLNEAKEIISNYKSMFLIRYGVPSGP